jgi:hypothetical protein
VVPTINILRQAFNHEELEILVENNESNDEESDSDLEDVHDNKKEMPKLSLETFADLSYLNNSKDAMDVKLLKYFENMPKQFIVANLLDPRQKTTIAVLQDEKMMSTKSFPQSNTKKTNTVRSATNNKSNEAISIDTINDIFDMYYHQSEDTIEEEMQMPKVNSNVQSFFPSVSVKSLFESQLASVVAHIPSPTLVSLKVRF